MEREVRIPLETSLLSAGTNAVPGTTDFSLFWILSHKGKILPKVGFDRPPTPPAVGFLVLLLKCGELE